MGRDRVADAPIGVVATEVNGREIRLVDNQGKELITSNLHQNEAPGNPADWPVAVELLDFGKNDQIERIERNREGLFYRTYAKNKWLSKYPPQQEQEVGGGDVCAKVEAAPLQCSKHSLITAGDTLHVSSKH